MARIKNGYVGGIQSCTDKSIESGEPIEILPRGRKAYIENEKVSSKKSKKLGRVLSKGRNDACLYDDQSRISNDDVDEKLEIFDSLYFFNSWICCVLELESYVYATAKVSTFTCAFG